MLYNEKSSKNIILNSLVFSGILLSNIINAHKSKASTQENIEIPEVVTYRSASCGSCKKWMYHLRDNGLEAIDKIVEDISLIKDQYQVPNNLRSCHSAQIDNYTIKDMSRLNQSANFLEKNQVSKV